MYSNIIIVLVAAVVSMLFGALWYSPLFFGKTWLKLMQIKPLKKTKGQKQAGMSMGATYLISFLSTFVTSYVLSRIVIIGRATTLTEGAAIGFWLWLGFMAVVTLGGVLWEGKSLKLYILNNAYNLLSLMLMGAILAGWR